MDECVDIVGTVPFRPRFPAGSLVRYPGLSRDDVVVANRFWARHGDEYDGASYNVRVGRGGVCPINADRQLRRDVYAFSALRIDMVAVRPGELWIVEFKPRMNVAAIGQLLAYGQLFPERYEFEGELMLGLACERTQRDLESVYTAQGLVVWVV